MQIFIIHSLRAMKKLSSVNYVYILRCADDTLYTGWTNDLKNRFKQHCIGKGAKYTKGRGPLKLVYFETFDNKNDAMKEEYKIKHFSRKEKLKLIETFRNSIDIKDIDGIISINSKK